MTELQAGARITTRGFRGVEAQHEVVREVGRGGFAVTYLARCPRWGETVLKVSLGGEAGRASLEIERRVLEGLEHPHVIPCVGSAEVEGGLVLAYRRAHPNPLSLMVSEEVRERLGGRRLPPPPGVGLELAWDLFAGLEHLHGRGFVHHDIKPDNVLVVLAEGARGGSTAEVLEHVAWGRYRGVLIDFGASRSVEALRDLSRGIVRPGEEPPQVTPAFAPPELLLDEVYHPSLDVYAAGLVLYAYLTGCAPYEHLGVDLRDLSALGEVKAEERAGNVSAYSLEALEDVSLEDVRLQMSRRELRRVLHRLLEGCLAPRFDERWSAAEARQRLEQGCFFQAQGGRQRQGVFGMDPAASRLVAPFQEGATAATGPRDELSVLLTRLAPEASARALEVVQRGRGLGVRLRLTDVVTPGDMLPELRREFEEQARMFGLALPTPLPVMEAAEVEGVLERLVLRGVVEEGDVASAREVSAGLEGAVGALGVLRARGVVKLSVVREELGELRRPVQEVQPDAEPVPEEPRARAEGLAVALDALVRSSRAELPNLLQLVRDKTAYIQRLSEVRLELRPTGIYAWGELVFEPDPGKSRWLLPAFMAGLRAVRPRDVTEESVRCFSEELAKLGPSMGRIERFRDWLWAEGAEGFEVALERSASEALDAVFSEDAAMTTYLEAAVGVPSGLRRGWSEVEEGEAARSVRGRGLARGEGEALRDAIEDEGAWDSAETSTVFALPELAAAASPQRLVQGVLGQLEVGTDLPTLRVLTTMLQGSSAVAVAFTARLLAVGGVGERIVEGLREAEGGVEQALWSLLQAAPQALAREVVETLGVRADGEDAFRAWLERLLRAQDLGWVLARLGRTPREEAARALARAQWTIAGANLASAQELLRWFEGAALAAVWREVPAALWERLRDVARDGVERGTGPVRGVVIALAGRPEGLEAGWPLGVLAYGLQRSKGRGWSDAEMRSACQVLSTERGGRRALVEFFEVGEMPAVLRAAALLGLREDPELLAATVGQRSRLLEAHEVRQAVKEARQWLSRR